MARPECTRRANREAATSSGGIFCHATWLKVLGGDPTKSLLHGDSVTVDKHYLDPRMMPREERKLFVPWSPDISQVEADVKAAAVL